jgi:hypothetical protein
MNIDKVLDHRDDFGCVEYLIKWMGEAYIHKSWHTEEQLNQMLSGKTKKLQNYMKALAEVSHQSAAGGEDHDFAEQVAVMRELERDVRRDHCKVRNGTGQRGQEGGAA